MLIRTDNLWMGPAEILAPPAIVVFRAMFSCGKEQELSFDFSADERCELFLDGEYLADGPERGAPERWYRQHCSVNLTSGNHCLTARVLCFGPELTAFAQMSIRHGFFFRAQSTFAGEWEYQIVVGCRVETPFPDWGAYPRIIMSGGWNPEILSGRDGEWRPVSYFADERVLYEPELPPMRRDEVIDYRREGRHIIFADYVCVRTEFVFSGTGRIKTRWMETPYRTAEYDLHTLTGEKGRRDGTYWVGNYDEWELSGGRCRVFEPWMHAGRHLEIVAEGDCRVESMKFYLTGFPYEPLRPLRSSRPELNRLLPLAFHTLERCSHETYMDCPFYEQLMYVGDAKMEALSSYVVSADDRLAIKALRMLSLSQLPNGMTASRYPDRTRQEIPVFALTWISMLYDFAVWRDDPEIVMELLPTARRIIGYLQHCLCDNLPDVPGWKFIDWVSGWDWGVPPGDCAFGWFAVKTLRECAALEDGFGNPAFAKEYRMQAELTAAALFRTYYDSQRKMYADDAGKRFFSEQAQVIALLAGDEKTSLPCGEAGLPQSSIYFSYYYLEACRKQRQPELFHRRLAQWYNLEDQGLKTLPETFGQTRSDCHAWGAHVLYHYYASILGIRPAGWGGKAFDLSPLADRLDYAEGTMPHREGDIFVRRERVEEGCRMIWRFPENISVSVKGCPCSSAGEQVVPATTHKEELIRRECLSRCLRDVS